MGGGGVVGEDFKIEQTIRGATPADLESAACGACEVGDHFVDAASVEVARDGGEDESVEINVGVSGGSVEGVE